MSKKMRLEPGDLKVQSFVTELHHKEENHIKAGCVPTHFRSGCDPTQVSCTCEFNTTPECCPPTAPKDCD